MRSFPHESSGVTWNRGSMFVTLSQSLRGSSLTKSRWLTIDGWARSRCNSSGRRLITIIFFSWRVLWNNSAYDIGYSFQFCMIIIADQIPMLSTINNHWRMWSPLIHLILFECSQERWTWILVQFPLSKLGIRLKKHKILLFGIKMGADFHSSLWY